MSQPVVLASGRWLIARAAWPGFLLLRDPVTDPRDHRLSAAAIYREAWYAGLRGEPEACHHRVPARRDAYARGWRDGQVVAKAGREFHRAIAAGARAFVLGAETGEKPAPEPRRTPAEAGVGVDRGLDLLVGRPKCEASSTADDFYTGSFSTGG